MLLILIPNSNVKGVCMAFEISSRHLLHLALFVSSSVAGLIAPLQAHAGEASGDSGAIVVNGQKESYKAEDTTAATKLPLSLKETPQSITVITRQRIEDFNRTTNPDDLHQTTGGPPPPP